jgi:hypothetical protein
MQEPGNKRQVLLMNRIIWAALMLGELMFMGVALGLGGSRQSNERGATILFYVAVAMAASSIPAGFFIRTLIFRAGTDAAGRVQPGRYTTGNIICWALCEGVAFLALVTCMIAGKPMPYLIPAIAGMAAQAITFPTGAQLGDAND